MSSWLAISIGRRFGHKYNVWVPTKDSGVDLLVTRKRGNGRAVGLQVKFSRSFDIPEELTRHVLATSWYTLDPKKIRSSEADLWVFVFMTLRHERYFVLIPTSELRKRIPRSCRVEVELVPLGVLRRGLLSRIQSNQRGQLRRSDW